MIRRIVLADLNQIVLFFYFVNFLKCNTLQGRKERSSKSDTNGCSASNNGVKANRLKENQRTLIECQNDAGQGQEQQNQLATVAESMDVLNEEDEARHWMR